MLNYLVNGEMKKFEESKKGVVIEFKISDSCDETSMEGSVEKALQQIESKNYMDELVFVGIKEVLKVGIAFCGKEVSLAFRPDVIL